MPLGSCPCLSVPFSPPVPASASCPGDAPGDDSVCPCLLSLPHSHSASLCLPCTATTAILTPVSDDGICPCLFVPIANPSNTTSIDATRTTNATFTTTTIRNAFRHVHMIAAQATNASSSIALMTAAAVTHSLQLHQECIMCPELHRRFAVAAMITAIHAFSSKATPRVQVTVGRVRYSRRVRADFKNASIGHSRVVFAMLLFAQEVQAFAGPEVGRAVATVSEPPTMSGTEVTQAITRSVQEPASEAKGVSGAPTQAVPTAYSRFVRAAMLIIPASIVCIILLMYPGNVAQSMRMPPVYDPNDHTQSFRAWSQDLMLWTISNELQPHQQAAMVVA